VRQSDGIDPPDLPGSLQQFIATVGWTFARTMPEISHEYTVRDKSTAGVPPVPTAWYDWFEQQIAEHGYQAKFAGGTYTYLDVDGYKYWVIRPVINRAKLDPAAGESRYHTASVR
jgi:hypothetical protein